MLLAFNVCANAVVFAATLWALLSPRVPTRTGGSVILGIVAFGAFGNIVSPYACHSEPEVFFNVAIAFAAGAIVWRLEARRWFTPGVA